MSIFYIPSESNNENQIIEILEDNLNKLSAKVGNPTSLNVSNETVKRDANGDFAAGVITTSGLSDGSKLTLQTTSGVTRLGVNGGPTMTGINNTAIGVSAMNANSTGGSNCCVGSNAGSGITSGSENVCVGHVAANNNLTTGTRNTLIGTGASTAAVNQTNSIAIGYASQAPASNTIKFGNDSITGVYTTGVLNAAGLESFGASGSTLNIASQNNTSTLNLGSGTGVQTINMGNNGAGTTTLNIGGGSDVVKLNMPLKDPADNKVFNANSSSCYVGRNVMPLASGTMNTGLGADVGQNVTNGIQNTFIGHNAGSNAASGVSYNTAVGKDSLLAVTGNVNTAVGLRSLEKLTSGTNNVAIGAISGAVGVPITTGSDNVFLGTNAGSTSAERVNGVAIGNNSRVDADNCIQLGASTVAAVKTSGTVYALGLESIGTNSTLNIASANNTNTVNIGSGTGVQTINMGNNGAGATTINLGGASDTVTLGGSISSIEGTVVNFKDPTIVFGYGSAAGSSGSSGVYLAEGVETLGCFMRLSSDRAKFEFKPRVGANTFVIDQSLQTTDTVTFGGLKLPTTGGSASTLNHYEEFTFSTALSGAASIPTNYISFIRIGSLVTMTVSTPISFTATATATLVNSTVIPARFRPSGYEQHTHIEIQANGVNADGMARVSAAGNLTLGTAHFGSFTNGQPCQVYPFAMSWSIVS